jgi:uncharacterized membrane protein (UPF0127 family)
MATLLAFGLSVWIAAAEPSVIPVLFPNGSLVRAEAARTPDERKTGLMHRSSLPLDRGMLFIFDQPGLHYFWMKDTLLSLDIVWLDSDKRIIHIEEGVPPCRKDPCASYGPSRKSRFVLEVNAGIVKKQGLSVGMLLSF